MAVQGAGDGGSDSGSQGMGARVRQRRQCRAQPGLRTTMDMAAQGSGDAGPAGARLQEAQLGRRRRCRALEMDGL